ncbi:hypothetical protein NEOLEDRAFT_1134125 [Neolentinus lepideus HHB14362 ss-1]|uniref:Uncharacterized protein n=1 Tax=Neolentinus lepideus HHB14362 ss-1 TaxID=1314782 RepID=A0A165SBQ8_9AGAM|nr:hypothetical protein NEOLEDRAFT_1134125 [Neolentinus lepideus HHB14362 ss-1]
MLSIADRVWINIRQVYTRVTLTRFTFAFFLLGFTHCFAQGIIQAFLFSVDDNAASFVSSIIQQANASSYQREFAYLTRPNGEYHLSLCSHIPRGATQNPCQPVYPVGDSNMTEYSSVDLVGPDQTITTIMDPTDVVSIAGSNSSGVILMKVDGTEVILSQTCVMTLVYPSQVINNSRREDLALLISQFWLFSISYFGLMHDSIPHILAAISTRVLATGWSAYSIWRTTNIKERFQHLIIDTETPCHRQLFPTYFSTRISFQIPDLVLNVTALVFSSYLAWHLVKDYASHSFKRVGPPAAIVRIYGFFLAVFVCMQLLVFFLSAAMGLWVDQLFNGDIARISSHTTIYEGLFLFTTIILIPWLTMGWYSVRLEKKSLMAGFLSLAFTLIVCWAVMFYSLVYRWTFIQWPFFACMTVSSFIVLIACFGFGVICWLNFNKGLKHWLYVEDVLAKSDFEPEVFPHDVEKVPFPGY